MENKESNPAGFYSEKELKELGISKIGKNVLISNKCSVYQADRMEIGDNVRIDDFCILIGTIKLGSNIHIGAFCHLSGGAGIVMEDYSGLSQRCSLYTQSDDYSGRGMTNPTIPEKFKKVKSGKIVLGRHVIIGASSVILPDVTIGEGASVGAMSLVNRPIEAWTMNAGIPCRMLRSREKDILRLEKEYEKECLRHEE